MVAGHRGDVDRLVELFGHDQASVRAAAIRGLARAGGLDDTLLTRAATDADPAVRRSVAEVAARLETAPAELLLDDPDPLVAEMAAWAAGERGDPAAAPRLAELAANHADALVREAAVAALGVLAVPETLPVVLAALDDRPAIRRRAVLALAPFEGPEVDAALRRAAEDRDWQTRQAAEDLLA